MKQEYVAPHHKGDGFNCPYCGAYAHQNWSGGMESLEEGGYRQIVRLTIATCAKCQSKSFWIKDKMIHPAASLAPMPSDEMPHDVKQDYMEARGIVAASPRSASALLRLALQKLMIHLEEKGENLNDDIGALVSRGLPAQVQKALDALRVIGNNAVHPGELDLKDDTGTATALFGALNMIVEIMMAQPRAIEGLYAKIPEGSKEAIRKRDSTKSP